jgi:hypothetical protein
MFGNFHQDNIKIIKKDGTVLEKIKAVVQPKLIVINDSKLIIDEGDAIQRVLSNGKMEEYIVEEPTFYEEQVGLPAHYQLKVRKSENEIQNNFEKEARNFFYDQIRHFKHNVGHSINWKGILLNSQKQPPHVLDILKNGLVARMEQEGLLENDGDTLTEKGYLEVYKSRKDEKTHPHVLYNQHNEFHGTGMVQQDSNNSSMTMTINNNQLEIFDKLKEISSSIGNNQDILQKIEDMELAVKQQNKKTYVEKYNEFIPSAANHMTLFAPFISELTKFFI